ncbi:MAG TPA: hypothetical protein VMV29_11615 [Ktedonobacterales bacterium]|nr:hypothetical protein [Ktedonobacterales bacterium]
MSRTNAINSVLTVSRDRSRQFVWLAPLAWLAVVAAPLMLSFALQRPLGGAPLIGVAGWLVALRLARWLSPAARADGLMRQGRYVEALTLCEQSLRVTGDGAWTGARRLVWLNRRTTILLALGQWDAALDAALAALNVSPDPETIANCAHALLRLNRYEEAATAARLALSLTRERSVSALATLAAVMLARGMPAEAEALARAGLTDVDALLPLVHPMSHMTCLTTLARAQRRQGLYDEAEEALAEMQKVARNNTVLRAMALVEEADTPTPITEDDSKDLDGVEETLARNQAFRLLGEAYDLAPYYTLWFVSQPNTLALLQDDPRLNPALAVAREEYARAALAAPDAEAVAPTLEMAQRDGRRRPARQANRVATAAQAITLAATLVLLLLWMWRFFIIAS